MATRISTTTGAATAPFGFQGTDLGYFSLTNHGYVLSTFGDTFDNPMPGGPGWRSPVILRTHNADLENGVKWDNAVGGARAKQVIDYAHQEVGDAYNRMVDGTTQIPNDVVHLPDGRFLMSTFVVRSWEQHGPNSWLTWCNRLWTSTETHAEHWERTKDLDTGQVNLDFENAGEWSKFQNATFVLWEDGYLYMFGTQSGRCEGGGIYLARCHWTDWTFKSRWQMWGWSGSQWEWTNHATPIIYPTNGGAIGEINAQIIGDQVVLAYMDYGIGSAVTRTATHPASVWTNPQVHATWYEIPNPYAPSLHPYSSMERPYMHLSQWTHINEEFYGCRFYSLDPLVSAKPPAKETLEGTGQATCTDLSSLDADQLAKVLTAETSVTAEELLAAIERAQAK